MWWSYATYHDGFQYVQLYRDSKHTKFMFYNIFKREKQYHHQQHATVNITDRRTMC